MLDCSSTDTAVGLPEADSVVISSRGQNDWVTAHSALIYVHVGPVTNYRDTENNTSSLVPLITIL